MTYLVHHGIVGQKWGVRRYQNEDGSLTEEGRKRYNQYLSLLASSSVKQKMKKLDDHFDAIESRLRSSRDKSLNKYTQEFEKDTASIRQRNADRERRYLQETKAIRSSQMSSEEKRAEIHKIAKQLENESRSDNEAYQRFLDKYEQQKNKIQEKFLSERKENAASSKDQIKAYQDVMIEEMGFDDIEEGRYLVTLFGAIEDQ